MKYAVEKRGKQMLVFCKATTEINKGEYVVLAGKAVFETIAIGDAKSTANTMPSNPMFIMSIDDARRLARQILSDTSADARPNEKDEVVGGQGGGI